MPHQCIRCGKLIDSGSQEILEGCSKCNGKFFFYVKDEDFKKINEKKLDILDLKNQEKEKIESDVRDILGLEDEEKPVILDLESVRIDDLGKFEIDIVSLMSRRPIVFKLEEGKYIIDLESSLPKGFKLEKK